MFSITAAQAVASVLKSNGYQGDFAELAFTEPDRAASTMSACYNYRIQLAASHPAFASQWDQLYKDLRAVAQARLAPVALVQQPQFALPQFASLASKPVLPPLFAAVSADFVGVSSLSYWQFGTVADALSFLRLSSALTPNAPMAYLDLLGGDFSDEEGLVFDFPICVRSLVGGSADPYSLKSVLGDVSVSGGSSETPISVAMSGIMVGQLRLPASHHVRFRAYNCIFGDVTPAADNQDIVFVDCLFLANFASTADAPITLFRCHLGPSAAFTFTSEAAAAITFNYCTAASGASLTATDVLLTLQGGLQNLVIHLQGSTSMTSRDVELDTLTIEGAAIVRSYGGRVQNLQLEYDGEDVAAAGAFAKFSGTSFNSISATRTDEYRTDDIVTIYDLELVNCSANYVLVDDHARVRARKTPITLFNYGGSAARIDRDECIISGVANGNNAIVPAFVTAHNLLATAVVQTAGTPSILPVVDVTDAETLSVTYAGSAPEGAVYQVYLTCVDPIGAD